MKVNINSGEGLKRTIFPDGQIHICLPEIAETEVVDVECSIDNIQRLYELLSVANAIDNAFGVKGNLHIPYLMGARYDRVMNHGDCVDLEVVAEIINSCKFRQVFLFDVHSDVALRLIDRSKNITNKALLKQYNLPDSILICPDSGASKRVAQYMETNPFITDVVYCTKTRNLSTGELSLKVLEPEKCTGSKCVIIDDLCDGGGTFLAIASQLTNPFYMTLIVSHGIFSKGVDVLFQKFDNIITTDSYPKNQIDKRLTIVPWTSI